MSFASLRRVLRSARKGLCSTCSKTKHPQLEAAGAGHVGCLIYTFETLGHMIRDEHDVTAMHVAARKGQISILIYLVENGLVGETVRAKNGATPAHDAAGTGKLECLRYILSHTKASANDVDNNNATPLHWAVQSGHLQIVQWLVVEAHAPIDTVAKNGVTPLHIAAARNYLDVLRWLVGHAYRHYPKPRRLVNAKDKNGATALYHAAHAGHGSIIRWLAEKGGGDPTIISSQGLAPMHAATVAGHLEAVKYLFQFGSATAPGGLRTTEGACALHFAAADGHLEILKWLLHQKECSGNERDYYQSTPMHDAAEHGHLKIVQVLFDHNADPSLTDIEGNTPRDLAEKNGHNKVAKFLAAAMRQKVHKGVNGSVVHGLEKSRGLSRQKHSKAEMIDSYRNAPPHQLPVNVFEGEDEDLDNLKPEGNEQWETLHDLMDMREIMQLEVSPYSEDPSQPQSAAEKRRKLEENLRREAEERRQKRNQLLQREQEYEKEIRDRLLAEESHDMMPSLGAGVRGEGEGEVGGGRRGKEIWRRKKGDQSTSAQLKRLSLPANLQLQSDTQITQRGLVERRTKEFELRSPTDQKRNSKILAKLWPGKRSISIPNTVLPHSQSWDSNLSWVSAAAERTKADEANEEDLPEPPPPPTVEYLLGKRPVNLRKRASQSLKDQIAEKVTSIAAEGADSDNDSVASSQSDHKSHHRKKSSRKKKKKAPKGDDDDGLMWQYNKLPVPKSSPPRERKFPVRQRRPTPVPSAVRPQFMNGKLVIPQKLDLDMYSAFDEVNPEVINSPKSPSSLSPLDSPSSPSPLSSSPFSSREVSPSHHAAFGHLKPARLAPLPPTYQSNRPTQATFSGGTNNHPGMLLTNGANRLVNAAQKATGHVQPKRGAPKPPPHVQNKNNAWTQQKPNRTSPISKVASSRKSGGQARQRTTTAAATNSNFPRIAPASKSPNDFMAALNEAIASSPKQPMIVRQAGRDDSSSSLPGTHSPTIDEIELQLNAMKSMLAGSASATISLDLLPPQRPPSPERQRHAIEEKEASESESDSSEYSSSSEDSSTSDSEDSSSEDSSNEESGRARGLASPRKPIIRNVGTSSLRGKGLGGFNRARLMARYPRLLRRKVIRLATILEVPEEIIYQAKTFEEQAVIFDRLHMEKRYMKAWRKYMQIMRSAYRKAEKMAQRKRRAVLAKTFYAWIQVRNMGAVEKDNMEKARIFYDRKLKKRVFDAWVYLKEGAIAKMPIARSTSLQLITAEENYLAWINEQLRSLGMKQVDNISDSLASGILIILTLAHASGKKPPKYNPHPKVRLHYQDNWKTAHEFMKTLGIKVKGIEPADLGNVAPAAVHNMFNNIIKWYEKKPVPLTVL